MIQRPGRPLPPEDGGAPVDPAPGGYTHPGGYITSGGHVPPGGHLPNGGRPPFGGPGTDNSSAPAPDTEPPGAFVVGVDGGGTGSRAMVLSLEGRELAQAQGPPALIHPARPGAAAEAVGETVMAVLAEAGLTPPAAALWAGLAGAGRPGAREGEEISLRSMGLARELRVGMDVEGAHRDAFGAGPGILMVVGTGSMVWGRDPEGSEVRVGGWGGVLGDEGSGHWLGLRALKAVARQADGRGPESTLTPAVLSALGLPDPPALIPWVAAATKGEIAALAPTVLAAAGAGDPVALELEARALEELAGHLEVARARWPRHGEALSVALVGGVVEEGGGFREELAEMVSRLGGVLCPHPVVPVRGAAELALEMIRPG